MHGAVDILVNCVDVRADATKIRIMGYLSCFVLVRLHSTDPWPDKVMKYP